MKYYSKGCGTKLYHKRTYIALLYILIATLVGCSEKCPDGSDPKTLNMIREIIHKQFFAKAPDTLNNILTVNFDIINPLEHKKDPEKYICDADITINYSENVRLEAEDLKSKMLSNDPTTYKEFLDMITKDSEANLIYQKMQEDYIGIINDKYKEFDSSYSLNEYQSDYQKLIAFAAIMNADKIKKEIVDSIPKPYTIIANSLNTFPLKCSIGYFSTLSKQQDGDISHVVGISGLQDFNNPTILFIKFLTYHHNNIAQNPDSDSTKDNYVKGSDSIGVVLALSDSYEAYFNKDGVLEEVEPKMIVLKKGEKKGFAAQYSINTNTGEASIGFYHGVRCVATKVINGKKVNILKIISHNHLEKIPIDEETNGKDVVVYYIK